MNFNNKLISGTLQKRYKRFLADILLETGELVTAHTPNSGSMKGLTAPGNPVYVSHHPDPKRKLKYTWEIVKVGRVWVGVNTHLPNHLVEEGIVQGVISELQGYEEIQREKKYGQNSRIDLLLKRPTKNGESEHCYVEVKNVTLVENDIALFPDAVTERGRKHLVELVEMVKQGHRAVMCFVLQRSDGKHVTPADAIDPEYGQTLRWAAQQGVEMLAYRARVKKEAIKLSNPLKVCW